SLAVTHSFGSAIGLPFLLHRHPLARGDGLRPPSNHRPLDQRRELLRLLDGFSLDGAAQPVAVDGRPVPRVGDLDLPLRFLGYDRSANLGIVLIEPSVSLAAVRLR